MFVTRFDNINDRPEKTKICINYKLLYLFSNGWATKIKK